MRTGCQVAKTELVAYHYYMSDSDIYKETAVSVDPFDMMYCFIRLILASVQMEHQTGASLIKI